MSVPDKIRQDAKDRDLRVTVRIGKDGVTENLISEMEQQLKARNLVKVKMNRGLFDRQERLEVWDAIAEACSAVVVDSRGNVAVFYRA